MQQQRPKVITSVAPYVTIANALQAIQLAHEDGFSGIELNEDHLHCLVQVKPNCLNLMREYSADKRMVNSLHRTLFRPSIDSENQSERKCAVEYTWKTLDYMEAAGISRMVLHSFSDLPAFFNSKTERANKMGYFLGCRVIQVYGLLAPTLKAYRQMRKEKIEACFMRSLAEIAKCAAAHQLIRTGQNTDLSEIFEPIHFHAVDTNGIIDDHRTLGKGKVNFENSILDIIERKLANTVVIEDSTRNSALESKKMLTAMIKKC
jgi:sugar phosphate isomerase/epimerase